MKGVKEAMEWESKAPAQEVYIPEQKPHCLFGLR